MSEPFRQQLYADAAAAALQAASLNHFHGGDIDDGEDIEGHRRVQKGKGKGTAGSMDKESCRNQTGYIGVRQRKWGMYAAEIRDGEKRRWLGSFSSGREAGMAYDSAAISQKGCKAKTNFRYLDFSSIPRATAETLESVRWDLLPKEIAEKFPIPSNPHGNGAREGVIDGEPLPPASTKVRRRAAASERRNDASEDDQNPPKRGRSNGGHGAMDPYARQYGHYGGDGYGTEDDAHMAAVAAASYYGYSSYPGMYPPPHMMEGPDGHPMYDPYAAYRAHYGGMMDPQLAYEDATAVVVAPVGGKKGVSAKVGREGSQPRWEESTETGAGRRGAQAMPYDYYAPPWMGPPGKARFSGGSDGGVRRGSSSRGRTTDDSLPPAPEVGEDGKAHSPDDGPNADDQGIPPAMHPLYHHGYDRQIMPPGYGMYPGQYMGSAAPAPPPASYSSTPGPTTGAVVRPRAVKADYPGAFQPYHMHPAMLAAAAYGHNPYMDPGAMHYAAMAVGSGAPQDIDDEGDEGVAVAMDSETLHRRWKDLASTVNKYASSSGGGAVPSEPPHQQQDDVMAALQNISKHQTPVGGIDPILAQEGAAAIVAAAAAAAQQHQKHEE